MASHPTSNPTAPRAVWPGLTLLLALFLAAGLGLSTLYTMPAVVPASAPAEQFSAERALQSLRVIAAEPHPTGSAANLAVGEYIIAQIHALGLEAEVQPATIYNRDATEGFVSLARVTNIMTRLPGTNSTGAVLVSGHYDSAPTTPGASDCGACAVTVLEALRALQAGPALQNDVIFLFTDGEELGDMGAQAFVQQHPWAREVRLILVLEAMGAGGASMVYSAGPQSAGTAGEALQNSPLPVGSSLLNALMWGLAGGSSSDLDELLELSPNGLAYIYLQGGATYHSRTDQVNAIDPRSLQHHGENILAAVRQFAGRDLSAPQGSAYGTYFTVWPGLAAAYPAAWTMPLALAATAGWLALTGLAAWRGRLRLSAAAIGALACLLSVLASAVVVTLIWWLLRRFNPNLQPFFIGGPYNKEVYLAAFVAISLGMVVAILAGFGRRFAAAGLLTGVLGCWAGLAVLTAWGMPGASYLFAWPLIFALAGTAWLLRLPQGAAWQRAGALTLVAAPAVLLAAPMIIIVNVLATRLETLSGLPFAAMVLPLSVCAGALVWPALDFVTPRRQGLLAVGLMLAGLALIGVATLTSGFSPQQPRPDTLVYWQEPDRLKAEWITFADTRSGRGAAYPVYEWTLPLFIENAVQTRFDPWLAGWGLGEFVDLRAPAPLAELPSSTVTVVEQQVSSRGWVSLRVEKHPEILQSFLQIEAAAPLTSVWLEGQPLTLAPGSQRLRIAISGSFPEGIQLEMFGRAGQPLTLVVQDQYPSLPPGSPQRPPWAMAAPYNQVADSSIVQRIYTWK